MTELKPCPFCGGEAVVTDCVYHLKCEDGGVYDKKGWTVGCRTVGCRGWFNRSINTEAEAIAAWNTRAAYEIDGWFYLPKPKQDIGYTSETMVKRTENGYWMGAIADVYENAVKEWQKQLNDYIIGRICEVFRPERTCSIVGEEYDDLLEYTIVEFSCGHYAIGLPSYFKYCPKCGAKVIQ